MFMQYLDVMLLFVSKTSPVDSQNSLYLKIFGFIRLDFMCFLNEGGFVQDSINQNFVPEVS